MQNVKNIKKIQKYLYIYIYIYIYMVYGIYGPISIQLESLFQLPKNNIISFI